MDDLTRERYPEPLVPACPVCGHQTPGMARYRTIRPHSERRVRGGRVVDTRRPCSGAGMVPEMVPSSAVVA